MEFEMNKDKNHKNPMIANDVHVPTRLVCSALALTDVILGDGAACMCSVDKKGDPCMLHMNKQSCYERFYR